MANPQIENGHTKIANELLEAICKTNLGPYESRILWYIVRKTYGWNQKTAMIKNSHIAEETGIPRPHVTRAIEKLLKRVIITRTGNYTMGLNKNYDEWLPIQVTRRKLPKRVTPVTQTGNKKLPKRVIIDDDTLYKENKDTIKRHIARVQEKYPDFTQLDYDAATSWIESYNKQHPKKKREVNLAFLVGWAKRNTEDRHGKTKPSAGKVPRAGEYESVDDYRKRKLAGR